MTTRACTKCSLNKSPDCFSWNNKKKTRKRSICKDCQALIAKEYRRTNKGKSRKQVAEYKKRKRDFLRKIKEQATCMDCGNRYPYYVYDFDHRDPTTKKACVARMICQGYGIDAIKKEIEKCDIVCANCHRERTYAPVV